jgi:hypothetical protein
MSDTNVDLEAVRTRLQKLLMVTEENGATEGETLAAAGRAAELMRKYQVTLTDKELRATGVTNETFDRSEPFHNVAADFCFAGLQKLCSVKIWYHQRNEYSQFGAKTTYRLMAVLGLKTDVEFTRWLYDMIDETITRETEHFRGTAVFKNASHKPTASSSFQSGMAARINARLLALADEGAAAVTSNGKALVVLKDDIVRAAFEKMQLKGGNASLALAYPISDASAKAAGAAAGDKVNLSRPVETEKRVKISA